MVLDNEEARWEEVFESVASLMGDHGHCDMAKVGGSRVPGWRSGAESSARWRGTP